jgi:hypothetical protein
MSDVPSPVAAVAADVATRGQSRLPGTKTDASGSRGPVSTHHRIAADGRSVDDRSAIDAAWAVEWRHSPSIISGQSTPSETQSGQGTTLISSRSYQIYIIMGVLMHDGRPVTRTGNLHDAARTTTRMNRGRDDDER